MKILLVEDNQLDIDLVRRSFLREGKSFRNEPVELTVVNRLSEALEALTTGTFNAVLLDMGLPDGNGFEVLNPIVQLGLRIPVIILTGNDDVEFAFEALRSGADDYLNKSVISRETLPRAVRYSIERNKRIRAESELEETRAGILAAEKIQRRFIPQQTPQLENFEIAGRVVSTEDIGGDLYDFLSYRSNYCFGVIADVSGHGLPSAMIMIELHGLLHGLVEQNMSIVRFVEAANHRADKSTESYQFVTMLTYELFSEDRMLRYVSSGHPGWIVSADGHATALETHHLPLGISLDEGPIKTSEVVLQQGDILIFPTDGVFEARNTAGKSFGTQQLVETVYQLRDEPADMIVQRVIEAVVKFSSPEGPEDDCTLVIIKVS